jgi:hypothetical protein
MLVGQEFLLVENDYIIDSSIPHSAQKIRKIVPSGVAKHLHLHFWSERHACAVTEISVKYYGHFSFFLLLGLLLSQRGYHRALKLCMGFNKIRFGVGRKCLESPELTRKL